MVAVMNGIKSLDGYYPMYPLSYKYKFRTIIEKQLQNDDIYKKYYDLWGSRVYTSLYKIENPNDLVDYYAAKKLGAEYVISKFQLESENLELKCENCKNNLYLYKIK